MAYADTQNNHEAQLPSFPPRPSMNMAKKRNDSAGSHEGPNSSDFDNISDDEMIRAAGVEDLRLPAHRQFTTRYGSRNDREHCREFLSN